MESNKICTNNTNSFIRMLIAGKIVVGAPLAKRRPIFIAHVVSCVSAPHTCCWDYKAVYRFYTKRVIMKLKCFGENTCPDWVLAGLYSANGLTASRAKSLMIIIAENLSGEPLQEENIRMILADIKKDSISDMKSIIASIIFVLRTAVKWGSDGSQLDADLRNVGVASEISRGLRVALDNHGQEIGSCMKKETLTFTTLKDVSCTTSAEGSVTCVDLNLKLHNVLEKSDESHSILIQKNDLSELLKELKKARCLMDSN